MWRYYLAAALFVVVISTLGLASPFLTKALVDNLVKGLNHQVVHGGTLVVLVFLILGFNLTITLLNNINGFFGDLLGAKLNTLLSQRYYDHILQLPLEYYDNQMTGTITSRLDRSIDTVSQLMNTLTNNFLQFFLTTIITLGAIAFYSWPIAVLLAVLFPFYFWLTRRSSREWRRHQRVINADTDYARGRFNEVIGQIRVVKAFVQERLESKIFADKRRDIEKETRTRSITWHKYDVARQATLNIIFFLIYAFVVRQTFLHHYTLGVMVLLLQLSEQARMPLFGSSWIVESLQRAREGTRDFFDVMETKPSILDRPGARSLKVTQGEVEYRSVNFAYSQGRDVLKEISFSVKPGAKLALVGESGEGKTTIANLLLRLYEPTGGQILIDGIDIRQVTQVSLRQQIGVVFQDPALFSGSVAENILYGTPGASDEAVIKAAKAANAHEFIMKLPDGYKTEIGERGIKLSGGQKQRVAIARAILKNPPILILDEATSSLDSKAEYEVQQALVELMRKRTTLIIAHRLSTIAHVDMIVGLRGGAVLEVGTPAELARGNGIYAELLKLQTPLAARERLKEFQIVS